MTGENIPNTGFRLPAASDGYRPRLRIRYKQTAPRERSVAGQAKARTEGRSPGRRPSLTEQQREYIRTERSKGVSQQELAKLLEVSRWTNQQVDR